MSTPPNHALPPTDRALDVVLVGATGFVGRLTAAHLARHAPPDARIALAGRSLPRLQTLQRDLCADLDDERSAVVSAWPLLVVDVDAAEHDPEPLAQLVASTRVVVTTVGPYARHGLPLVRACAEAGTHYADLTGEAQFVRRCIDVAHARARETGARIVSSCGFDSVPSDLGVLLAHRHAAAAGSGELLEATFTLLSARGGFSGGTVDSLRHQVDEVRADPELARVLADPYALSPDRGAEADLGSQPDLVRPGRDATGRWVAPFVMASHNTRIVRRSNALQGWAYGRRLRYTEDLSCGRSALGALLAVGVAVGTRVLPLALGFGPARAVLDRVLPDPGTGPSERTRDAGYFRAQVRATTADGADVTVEIGAQGDPGYAATAVMLGESALCLALDTAALPAAAGVLTPATGMGDALADRLRANGFRLDVVV